MTNSLLRPPSFDEVIAAFETIQKVDQSHPRAAERIQVVIPGEVRTKDGMTIPVRLRDLSSTGIGFFHYGTIERGEVSLKLAVHTYRIDVKWCVQCQGDLYMSGGPILGNEPAAIAT
jgi:hypothetical protein